MNGEEIYKNRDMVLGEIHESTKNTEKALGGINQWCKEHDKKDDRRFLIGAASLLVIALATGVTPEIVKLLTGH